MPAAEPQTTNSPESVYRTLLNIWLIIMLIIALGSLLPWAALAFFAMISYPSDDREFSMYIFLTFFYTYPIFPLWASSVARKAYKNNKDSLAWALSSLSIAPALVFSLLLYFNAI